MEESWSCPYRQGRLLRVGPSFLLAPPRERPCSGRRRLTVCTLSHFLLVAYAPLLPELAKPVPARVRGLTEGGGGGKGLYARTTTGTPSLRWQRVLLGFRELLIPVSLLLGGFRFCRQRPSQLVKPNFTTL